MPDKYKCFAELKNNEIERRDYRRQIERRQSGVAIVAPHGGKIEPGTSEIARAIAGDLHSLYLFEGIKRDGNKELHISSANFDDNECLELIRECDLVVAIHGKGGVGLFTQFGGRDHAVRDLIQSKLEDAGFPTDPDANPGLAANSRLNICNRGRTGRGVQLEIRFDLRRHLTKESGAAERLSRYSQAIATAIDRRLHGGRE